MSTREPPPEGPAERPALRVVRGEPTSEELAVLIALASAAGDGAEADDVAAPRGGWSDPVWRLRGGLQHGAGGWRSAAR